VTYLLEDLIRFSQWEENRRRWSHQTFGTPEERGPLGPLRHLQKEVVEVEKAITEDNSAATVEEIGDCIFLISDLLDVLGVPFTVFVNELERKLEVNQNRKWGPKSKDSPVEHVRD
jgi:NTP pyrophosphatase (non-canonical NTP hydrolase)